MKPDGTVNPLNLLSSTEGFWVFATKSGTNEKAKECHLSDSHEDRGVHLLC